MKKRPYWLAILIAVISGLVFFIFNYQEKQEFNTIVHEQKISAKEVKKQYDNLKIGDEITNISKILGSPIYTESYLSESDNSSSIYTWGSRNTDEIGSRLTVTTQNQKVVGKSISGLYVPFNKENLISSKKYEDITLNEGFKFEQAVKQFGEPNDISEFKNTNGKLIKNVTWSTNTNGPLGSYLSITFTDNIATNKNEFGLN